MPFPPIEDRALPAGDPATPAASHPGAGQPGPAAEAFGALLEDLQRAGSVGPDSEASGPDPRVQDGNHDPERPRQEEAGPSVRTIDPTAGQLGESVPPSNGLAPDLSPGKDAVLAAQPSLPRPPAAGVAPTVAPGQPRGGGQEMAQPAVPQPGVAGEPVKGLSVPAVSPGVAGEPVEAHSRQAAVPASVRPGPGATGVPVAVSTAETPVRPSASGNASPTLPGDAPPSVPSSPAHRSLTEAGPRPAGSEWQSAPAPFTAPAADHLFAPSRNLFDPVRVFAGRGERATPGGAPAPPGDTPASEAPLRRAVARVTTGPVSDPSAGLPTASAPGNASPARGLAGWIHPPVGSPAQGGVPQDPSLPVPGRSEPGEGTPRPLEDAPARELSREVLREPSRAAAPSVALAPAAPSGWIGPSEGGTVLTTAALQAPPSPENPTAAGQPVLRDPSAGFTAREVDQTLGQIVDRARLLVEPGRSTLEIRLQPALLGRIRIETVLDSGESLKATILVEEPRVRLLLEGQLHHLTQRLEAAGVELDSVTLQDMKSDDGRSAPSSQGDRQSRGNERHRAGDGGEENPSAAPSEAGPTGLDDGRMHYFA